MSQHVAPVILMSAWKARRGAPVRPRRAVQELAIRPVVARGAYAKHPDACGHCACGAPLGPDEPSWRVECGRIVRASCGGCGPDLEPTP